MFLLKIILRQCHSAGTSAILELNYTEDIKNCNKKETKSLIHSFISIWTIPVGIPDCKVDDYDDILLITFRFSVNLPIRFEMIITICQISWK